MEVVEQAHRAGVPMAYGSDLIGRMHRRQSEEFELRADLVPAADLVRSATLTGAALIRREHDLGQLKAGYKADLIVVDDNPLDNVRVLAQPESSLRLIMKSGRIVEAVHEIRSIETLTWIGYSARSAMFSSIGGTG